MSSHNGERTWRFSKRGRDEQARVRGNLRANNSEMLREAALAGVGLILMPTWLIGGDLGSGRLRPVLMEWQADVGHQSAAARQEGGIYALYCRSAGVRQGACFHRVPGQAVRITPYWDRT
jgi:DNA-binding transcriptional LysR family regulator